MSARRQKLQTVDAETLRLRLSVSAMQAAPMLIGWTLLRQLADGTILSGRIVETEAYCGPRDRASHAFGGRRTARNESMYGPAGTAYVYFTYGMHHCCNVTCATPGVPEAVLIRALEPLEGLESMHAARASKRRTGAANLDDKQLCSGPAKLCQALQIDRSLDGIDLLAGADGVRLLAPAEVGDAAPRGLERGPRIGVGYAGDWAERPMRWWARGNPNVSRRA